MGAQLSKEIVVQISNGGGSYLPVNCPSWSSAPRLCCSLLECPLSPLAETEAACLPSLKTHLLGVCWSQSCTAWSCGGQPVGTGIWPGAEQLSKGWFLHHLHQRETACIRTNTFSLSLISEAFIPQVIVNCTLNTQATETTTTRFKDQCGNRIETVPRTWS